MPTVQSPAKVLVSGANGYVAIWVVRSLLEKGYSVRGTVRSPDKGNHLTELFKSYGDKFELVVVEDITKEGAFDEAVKGVDAIEHTASPFHNNAEDPEELIRPAVDGTVGILKSAFKYGSSVKRVVVTSSCASVYWELPEPRVFSELDWNEIAVKDVQANGKAAATGNKYRASKILAERAARDFVEENKPEWDLVVLNPPFVFGPPIHAVSSTSALNTSVNIWHNLILTSSGNVEIYKSGNCWVDVRDLGIAHVRAIEKAEAGGERIIVTSGSFVWQDFINGVNALPQSTLSKLAKSSEIPRGDPSFKETTPLLSYDTSKAARVLGLGLESQRTGSDFIVLRDANDCAKGTVEEFVRRGW